MAWPFILWVYFLKGKTQSRFYWFMDGLVSSTGKVIDFHKKYHKTNLLYRELSRIPPYASDVSAGVYAEYSTLSSDCPIITWLHLFIWTTVGPELRHSRYCPCIRPADEASWLRNGLCSAGRWYRQSDCQDFGRGIWKLQRSETGPFQQTISSLLLVHLLTVYLAVHREFSNSKA